MADFRTISDRLAETATKKLHQEVTSFIGQVATTNYFRYGYRNGINIVVPSLLYIQTPKGEVEVNVQSFLLQLKERIVENNLKQVIEHEHENFIKKVEELDFFVKNQTQDEQF